MGNKKRSEKYAYLTYLFKEINKFLRESEKDQAFEESVVILISYCVLLERTLKIKLHKKNPILAYKELKNEQILQIAKDGDISLGTIDIDTALKRFNEVFDGELFDPKEMTAIKILYQRRNIFIHSFHQDDRYLKEKKEFIDNIQFVWSKTAALVKKVLGSEISKVKTSTKKYTEKQIQDIFDKNLLVRVKDDASENRDLFYRPTYKTLSYPIGFGEEKCPRCNNYTLSKRSGYDIYSPYQDDQKLYKCSHCNLELTEDEYERLKEILEK